MRIDRISKACCPGAAGPVDLSIVDGMVAGCNPTEATDDLPGRTLAAGGRVVVPAFVDAHVHLDKAYLVEHPALEGDLSTHLDDAIDAVGRLRDVVTLEEVRAGAERAVDTLVRNGTTAARVHVEVDPAIGLAFVSLHQSLAADVSSRCGLQLVAFPQRGLELPGAAELLVAAMKEGLEVVGGCPYVDDDPARHLDLVFALAERHGVPVDLHLDFSDDPGRSLLGLVAERTAAHAMAGQVTVGHVTTLAAMAPYARAEALELLARHGINLVALPVTDLHLAGRGDPATRSVAPVLDAAAAGVRVAVANNNIANPFAPLGNGSLIQAAWLTGVVSRATSDHHQEVLLDAITTTPASILGLPLHGAAVGAAADLAVLDTTEPTGTIRSAPGVSATLRAGQLVHLATSVPVIDAPV
ncbi:amidohydrolase family protein [soil metagenome]